MAADLAHRGETITLRTSSSYDKWSDVYDSVANPTRDLATVVLHHYDLDFRDKAVVEIACGTGANCLDLVKRSGSRSDLTSGLLASFCGVDISQVRTPWFLGAQLFDSNSFIK